MAENLKGPREVVAESGFEILPPTGSSGGQAAHGKVNRGDVESGVESTAADEADLLRIEFVEIVHDAADGKTFKVVGRIVEEPQRNGAAIKHEVLADVTA